MELLQFKFNIIVLFFIAINCVWSVSVEPKYTKFEYEEQLLEKVVRFEVYVENLNIAIQKFISDFSIIVNETKKFTEKEISIGNDRMNLMKSEIEDFNQNVTSTMAQERQSIRDFQQQLNKTLENKSEELTQYEEQLNKKIETKIEELTRFEEQLNQKFENKTEELSRLAVTPLIAFNAYSTAYINKLSARYHTTVIIFHNVFLNEGGCYDNTTGYFTASVDGIYQFNAQLCFVKGRYIDYSIYVGSAALIKGETRAASDSSDAKCDSFSGTTRVRKGQQVYVTAHDWSLKPLIDDWNSFSGSIIRQL